MADLIDTTEMYLKTIFELEEEGIVPLRARIAERLHQSGPTVSQTVARMERDGLVHVDEDRHLEFTDEGRLQATRVMRKHRLVERLLVDVIGLDWELAHNEACRWEHVVSEAVERLLVDLLHSPAADPYGNLIPGLAELGNDVAAVESGDQVQTLRKAAAVAARQVSIRNIGEPLQVDEKLLAEMRQANVLPGASVTMQATESGVELVGDERIEIGQSDSNHIFVTAD
jgi:DtxR family Mn-dependent transcriptional regulator